MTMKDDSLQVVVFHLEGKILALDILKVQEILRMVEITPVPNMPPFALGVINLRGKITPIINIREKLNFPARTPTSKTCIVLARSDSQVIGFLVDEVSEVQQLSRELIEKPESGPEWMQSDLFLGVGKLPQGLLMIIDSDRLLSPGEKKQLRRAEPAEMPSQS